MESIGDKIAAIGYPAKWQSLAGWECPGGCKDDEGNPTIIRGRGDPPAWTGDVTAYAYERCCSDCAPKMIAKHLQRDEILRRAQAPRGIAGRDFRAELVANEGEQHWPRDPRRLDYALEDWRGEPETLTIVGPNGRGKSMLAAELLVRLFRAGMMSQLWLRASQIVDEHFSGERDRYLRRLAEAVTVLVLDEFGRGQHSNQFAHALVGEVIDQRVSEGRVTIITTNLAVTAKSVGPGEPSIEAADSAVYDRLASGLVIRMHGESRRRP